MNDFFYDNRKKMLDLLDEKSAVVLFAGQAPVKRGDETYSFSPDRNFYYFTGLDNQNLIYFAYKKTNGDFSEYLFLERPDPINEKWIGKVIQSSEAENISKVSNFKYIDEFEGFFSSTVFFEKIENIFLNLENRNMKPFMPEFQFAENIKSNYPQIVIKNCYDKFAEFRKIKQPFEIEKIKKAIDITKKGVLSMMKNSKSGMFEYEIEAYFDFVVKKNGANDFAFKSIVASGKNATVLHYSKNNCKIKFGDLVLVDVGAQFDYYNGDITRTFPADGKFSERQKIIYNIVLNGQKKVIQSIKPNIPFKSLNDILKEFYFEELKNIGLISANDSIDSVSKYYFHNVSHLLGLETHDVGRNNENLIEKNMVFTVEPGLYIEEEGIGIRIEDNILVTENGCEVLSKDIIKEISDIEDYMKKS